MEVTFIKDEDDTDEEAKAELEDEVNKMFSEADTDLSGMIDYDEFCNVMKKHIG